MEELSDASLLGELLVLPANVRLDWKVITSYKQSSLFCGSISDEEKKRFTRLTPDGDVFTGEMKSKFGTLKNWNFEEKKSIQNVCL